MGVIGFLLFFVTVLLWHEAAHFIAADRYKAAKYIAVIRSKHWLGKWFLIGPAIGVNSDSLTDRQLWVTMLAPLALLIPAAVALLLYSQIAHGLLLYGASVWIGAGVCVFISDLPAHFFVGLEDENYDHYILWNMEGRHD